MRRAVLGAFLLFWATAGQALADDLGDRFKNDFDGTLAPVLRIPPAATPDLHVRPLTVPVSVIAPKPRLRPPHDIAPNAALPAARAPTAERVVGHLKTDHRKERNHVNGRGDNRVKAVFAAAGDKFRLLLHWFGEQFHAPNTASQQ
jgi:hypothetical protein